jgi:hypothetical protein
MDYARERQKEEKIILTLTKVLEKDVYSLDVLDKEEK